MYQLFAIAFGGALGALSRFILSEYIYGLLGRTFPYGTLTVNIVGSFVMGLGVILLHEKWQIDPIIKTAILVGFLGAFTTFSSFSLDTLTLIQKEAYLKALYNIVISIFACLLATFLGFKLGRYFC